METNANGLASALEELTISVSRLARIDCSFEQTEEIDISDETIATHLFRIAQEAINNAIKHAAAKRISVKLGVQRKSISLEVRDDGIGIGNSSMSGSGLGLNILHIAPIASADMCRFSNCQAAARWWRARFRNAK